MKKQIAVVTGGAGFIGSHLCSRLLSLGYKVISLDNYFAGFKENHIEGADYREGHTKDIEKHITEKPDIVFHLGEYSRVEISLEEPGIVWDLNVAGTIGVLEFWRKLGTKLVYAGSSTKFALGDIGKDQTPYAFSKATNTELIQNYAKWYELPYAIAYFYNAYGEGERPGKYGTVIEKFKQRFLNDEKLIVHSPGTQKRNFTHVLDIVDGLILVAEKGNGNGYALGSNKAYSILEIAELFESEIELKKGIKGNRLDAEIDLSKSSSLGWKAERSVEKYIKDIKDIKES